MSDGMSGEPTYVPQPTKMTEPACMDKLYEHDGNGTHKFPLSSTPGDGAPRSGIQLDCSSVGRRFFSVFIGDIQMEEGKDYTVEVGTELNGNEGAICWLNFATASREWRVVYYRETWEQRARRTWK